MDHICHAAIDLFEKALHIVVVKAERRSHLSFRR
jgi:hypothetical protein